MNEEIIEALREYATAVANKTLTNYSGEHNGKSFGEWLDLVDDKREKLFEAIENYKNNNNPVTNLEARIVTLENSIKQLFDSKRFEVCQTLFGVPAEKGLTQADLFQDVFLGKANTPPVGVGFAK